MNNRKSNSKKAKKQPSREKRQSDPVRISVGWGRGASEYRPGVFSKHYLAQHGEGCCADIFFALKNELKRINQERVEIGDKPIRGCTYSSFSKYWFWFKQLELIETTDRQEPAVYPFLKQRQFYRLTTKGEAEEAAWQDPLRAAHPEFG
jgi:hypothetical protein